MAVATAANTNANVQITVADIQDSKDDASAVPGHSITGGEGNTVTLGTIKEISRADQMTTPGHKEDMDEKLIHKEEMQDDEVCAVRACPLNLS